MTDVKNGGFRWKELYRQMHSSTLEDCDFSCTFIDNRAFREVPKITSLFSFVIYEADR